MISFENDYNTGAHPAILEALAKTNMEMLSGYGTDTYTEEAISKIREITQCPEAQIYLAVGGTQTNQLVISTMLKDYEGVVAADTGHVSVHEAGAIEYSGHKVLTIPGEMGKMKSQDLKAFLENFYADGNHEHMVFPGMVYISYPTEYGSIYSNAELEAIYEICQSYEMPLYIDGARLAYGLMSEACDMTMADIARLCDVFYIGGTKVGALCGEAIVFTKNNMPKYFVTLAKQRGALLAKGRLLGIQFATLFSDNLYLKNGEHAILQKNKMVKILKDAGYEFFYESPTNQQFILLDKEKYEWLKQKVTVSFWEQLGDKVVVRFATSWSTTNESLEELKRILSE